MRAAVRSVRQVRVIPPSLDQGEALVYSFRLGAMLHDRMAVEIVIFSEGSGSFPQNNGLTIRAEERVALAVRVRPTGSPDGTSCSDFFENAGKPDVAALYISRGCKSFGKLFHTLGRDVKRVEDVDSSGPDHGADSVRCGCCAGTRGW
jgi:hypothetical protein